MARTIKQMQKDAKKNLVPIKDVYPKKDKESLKPIRDVSEKGVNKDMLKDIKSVDKNATPKKVTPKNGASKKTITPANSRKNALHWK